MGEEKEVGKYNGWANYETWAVKLWLDNEEPSYRYWTDAARSWHGRERAADGMAGQLKEEVDEASPLVEPSLYSDLLGSALAEVDWLEIAEAYLEEVEPAEDGRESTGGGESCDSPEADELIFAYTREQAVADGVLVDVTATAGEAGFRVPVALTRAVWAEFVEAPDGVEGQDESGRLWDVLWMCRFGVGRGGDRNASEVLFQLHVRNDDREGVPPLATLKAVCGPDDDGGPCVTVMLPDED